VCVNCNDDRLNEKKRKKWFVFRLVRMWWACWRVIGGGFGWGSHLFLVRSAGCPKLFFLFPTRFVLVHVSFLFGMSISARRRRRKPPHKNVPPPKLKRPIKPLHGQDTTKETIKHNTTKHKTHAGCAGAGGHFPS